MEDLNEAETDFFCPSGDYHLVSPKAIWEDGLTWVFRMELAELSLPLPRIALCQGSLSMESNFWPPSPVSRIENTPHTWSSFHLVGEGMMLKQGTGRPMLHKERIMKHQIYIHWGRHLQIEDCWIDLIYKRKASQLWWVLFLVWVGYLASCMERKKKKIEENCTKSSIAALPPFCLNICCTFECSLGFMGCQMGTDQIALTWIAASSCFVSKWNWQTITSSMKLAII